MLPISYTYNGIFDNRQQTNYVRAVSQILQNLYFALYFPLFHRLHTRKTTLVLHTNNTSQLQVKAKVD